MTPRNFEDFIRRDLERDMAHHERLQAKQQPPLPPPPSPQSGASFLSQVPTKTLSWLWPGRIPLGHLTLLDAAPGSGLSLLALALAAAVSSGSPLPDGTPTQQGDVLLLAPYDSPTDTLKPRLEAAGGDPAHVLLVHPFLEDASRDLARTRSYTFPRDLDYLAGLIRSLNARLVIIDPASAIPGLSRCLPALVTLARQTTCAILLTRSLRQAPADPLHAPAPSSLLLQAARSRLLLAPTPAPTASSSYSPPNMPLAQSQTSWPTTSSPLKAASPPSTGWASATATSSPASPLAPCVPPTVKPSCASCTPATLPSASPTFSRPPATIRRLDAGCWCV